MDGNQLENAKRWYKENKEIAIKCAEKISKMLEEILEIKNIEIHSINCRVKTETSFIKKCEKDTYNSHNDIMDIIGIRIITYTNIEVSKICQIIEEEFEINKEHSGSKKEKMPEDRVGYLSEHFIANFKEDRKKLSDFMHIKDLTFEIQVRTLLQHTWAEIEHDKNYKFVGGSLPKELKRKFYLIAGTLELLDSEFERLAIEIDEYTKDVENAKVSGYKDIGIDVLSLTQYLIDKFPEFEDKYQDNDLLNDVIEELCRYEIVTLQSLDALLNACDTEKLVKIYVDGGFGGNLYAGILRDIMVIENQEKFFKKVYPIIKWSFDTESVQVYSDMGVDIYNYLDVDGNYIYTPKK